MAAVTVMREADPPVEALRPIVGASSSEGFTFASRLLRDWKDGVQSFSGDAQGLFVAWQRATVVGFCVLQPHGTSSAAAMAIDPVYVLPDQRRQGVGRMLVERAIHYGRRRHRAAHLSPKTHQARAFCAALGFTPGVRTFEKAIVAPRALR